MRDGHRRSIVKAVSYRFLGTAITIALVFVFTGKAILSFSIGGLEIVIKSLAFYLHERLWEKIGWGKYEKK